MAHSDNPQFDEDSFETLDEEAAEILEQGGNVDYHFESDSKPVEVDLEQGDYATDSDGNRWRTRKVVIHVEPVVVK